MQQLGKYRIDSKLGEGAMGFVYKAWHPGFNDYVALKTIQDARLEGQELLERFKIEGQALAKLKHQNIVQIYDADQANGVHFIVMEFMNGGSLERIISKREVVPLARRVGYLVPVCHALNYAHKRGLFHRDIKPANIMLHIDGSEEIVKVVDFGIARLVDSSHTQTKVRIGSPYYMAPELITASTKANEKTDIWALGVTLYELIAYQRPFEGSDAEDLAHNIVRGLHKPLTQIVPECPKDLSCVVEKTLQKDPGSRYQTVEDLLFELEPIAKRLRTDVAGSLVRRAKDLLEIGEYESAKSALEEAKKYDSTNQQARSLLQKVEEELRRKELLPRLQEDLKLGRKFMGFGQYREAKVAAEHAIGLDSRFEPAHKLLADIQEAEARAEEIQQKLGYAQRCVIEGELTEASRTVDEVLSLDADNREAMDLSTKIRNRREELERRKKLNQFLRSAEDLHIVGKYDECLALLEQALREFPENAGLQKRKEDALAEKSEQLRQSLLNTAKRLRNSQQFDQALKTLDDLLVKFPSDSAGVLLRSSIQKERDQEHLNKQLGLAWDELRSLKHQGKFSQALGLAKDLIVTFPAEGRIKEFARELDAEIRLDQMHAQLDAAVSKIQGLIRDSQFSEAILASGEALKVFPDNALLASLHKEGKSQQQRKEIHEKQSEYVSKVRQLISEGRFEAAAELGRKGLGELGDHPGLREALGEAERCYALQVEKARQREAIAAEIEDSCEKGDIGAATRIFQSAVRDGVIETKTSLHATLIENIKGAKEKAERDRRLNAAVSKIQGLIRDSQFSEAILASGEALKVFPDNALLASLHKEGKSQQQRKEIHEKQSEYVSKVRQLISEGRFEAAAELGRKGLGELGDHPGLREALGEAERCYALQVEKARQREAIAAEIEDSCEKGDIGAATRIFQSAVRDGVIETKTSLHATLIENIKGAKEKAERDRRLNAAVSKIQGLIRDGQFSGAVLATQEALKAFPDNALLASLLKEGKSQQRRKEIREKQNDYVSKVRQLIATDQFKAAAELARKGLAELGEHPGLHEVLEEAERGYALQVEKIRQREAVAAQIEASCEKRDIGAATRIFQNAVKEGVIERNTSLHATLIQNIKGAEEKAQKERELQIELKRRDIHEAMDRKEFPTAIGLANDLERAFGFDRETSDLRRAADAELEADRIARQERDEILQRASDYLNSGNVAAADQMLRNSWEAGILKQSDPQVVALLGKAKELLDRDKERRKKLKGIAGHLGELLRKGNLAEANESGQRALEAEGHDEAIADLVKRAKIGLAREEALQKRRLAELRSIRGLLEEGDPRQAKKVLEDALRQGVLDRNARDVVELRSEVDESVTAIVEAPATVEPTSEPTSADDSPLLVASTKTGSNKLLLGTVAAIVLAAVVGGAIYLSRRGSLPPPPPNDQIFWDKAESAMSRSPRDFKEALADYAKVAGLHGSHQNQAQHQIDEIQTLQSKEESLLQQAQDAMNKPQPDYPSAIQFFEDVVKIDGDRKADAESLLRHAEDLSKGKDPAVLAEQELSNADQLAAAGQWEGARRLYQQVKQAPEISASIRTRAVAGFQKADLHANEQDLWKRAIEAEGDNQIAEARSLFERVARMRLDHTADAQRHIHDIDARISFEKAKAEESNRENAWLELKGRIGQLQGSQDKGKLLAAQQELKPYMSTNDPYSADARDLSQLISENLARLDTEESWKSLSEQYKQAVGTGDKTSLGQIANKLKPFMNGGPHAQDAANYTANIEKIMLPPPPPPPGPVGSGSKPAVSENADVDAVRSCVQQLSSAFAQRSVSAVSTVWPSIQKSDREVYKKVFEDSRSFEANFNPPTITFQGTSDAVAVGTYAWRITKGNGVASNKNGVYDIRLHKDSGGWKIVRASFDQ